MEIFPDISLPTQRHCLYYIRNTNLWKSFHSTAGRSLQPPQNIVSTAGSQEYSSKNVGVTFGIVLGIIGPILGILAFIAYKLFDNNKKRRARGEYSPPSQQKMMSRPQPVRTPVPSAENLHDPDDE